MPETVTVTDVRGILTAIAADIERAKDYLTALDAASGDGDLGVTMVVGFRGITKALDGIRGDISSVLLKSAVTLSNSAPSTMGALLGTALMRAANQVKGKSEIGLPEITEMAQAAEQGIRDLGKAEAGDKTILDAFVPAVAALVESTERNAPLLASLELAQAEAERGLERTIGLKSKVGRAAWLGDRTIGHPDAGAACLCLMLESAVRYMSRDPDHADRFRQPPG